LLESLIAHVDICASRFGMNLYGLNGFEDVEFVLLNFLRCCVPDKGSSG
jgi:hypothetical protein